MGILYMIRHGQASFGSENFDRISEEGSGFSKVAKRMLKKYAGRTVH